MDLKIAVIQFALVVFVGVLQAFQIIMDYSEKKYEWNNFNVPNI